LSSAGSANQFLVSGGASAVPSWRVLGSSDIPNNAANTTGTAAGLSVTLALTSGGTGQSSAQAAMNALAGATTSGYYLRGNGTNVVMNTIQGSDVPTLNQNTTGTATYADSLNRTADARTGFAPNTIGGNIFKLYFGTMGNGTGGNYSDAFVFNSWVDGSAGATNMLMLDKGTFNIRMYRGTYGSASNFTSYNDCLMVNSSGLVTNYSTVSFSGDVIAYSSDDRLKKRLRTIESPLEKLQSLSGFIYVHNELAKQNGLSGGDEMVGVSAQEVQKVVPQAVKPAPFDLDDEKKSKSGQNYLTVQYERLVPLLIEALKEESRKRESLEELVRSLDTRIKILEQR
jgi:hypothetical protein